MSDNRRHAGAVAVGQELSAVPTVIVFTDLEFSEPHDAVVTGSAHAVLTSWKISTDVATGWIGGHDHGASNPIVSSIVTAPPKLEGDAV
ncbi:MAG: hypothetical protein GWQ05_21895 [Verrucomicrobiaceae bacterium]|nr:hypothetical protein [Verrucomicrobiaceae bacterium]